MFPLPTFQRAQALLQHLWPNFFLYEKSLIRSRVLSHLFEFLLTDIRRSLEVSFHSGSLKSSTLESVEPEYSGEGGTKGNSSGGSSKSPLTNSVARSSCTFTVRARLNFVLHFNADICSLFISSYVSSGSGNSLGWKGSTIISKLNCSSMKLNLLEVEPLRLRLSPIWTSRSLLLPWDSARLPHAPNSSCVLLSLSLEGRPRRTGGYVTKFRNRFRSSASGLSCLARNAASESSSLCKQDFKKINVTSIVFSICIC